MPDKQPTDSVQDLLIAIMRRFGLQSREAAQSNFLSEFREGKLGKVLLDD